MLFEQTFRSSSDQEFRANIGVRGTKDTLKALGSSMKHGAEPGVSLLFFHRAGPNCHRNLWAIQGETWMTTPQLSDRLQFIRRIAEDAAGSVLLDDAPRDGTTGRYQGF